MGRIIAIFFLAAAFGGCTRGPSRVADTPVVYDFAARVQYADGAAPESLAAGGDGSAWRLPGLTRVSWKVAIPQDAFLRLLPSFAPGDASEPVCRVQWILGERRVTLATFSRPPATPVVVRVPWQGKRGRLEFESLAPREVTWNVAALCGRVDSRDANVILLTIDSLGAKHVGAYGYSRPTTPFLDSLAKQGTLFKRPFSCANFSISSHASMLTGRYPQSHGIRYNGLNLNRQQRTLADILNRQRIKTVAYLNWTLLGLPRMTGQGFRKVRCIKGTPDTVELSGRNNVYANGLRWIESERDNRFFLWIHSQFLHLDRIPEPYGTMFIPAERREANRALLDRIRRGSFEHLLDDFEDRRVVFSEDDLRDLTAVYDGMARMTDDYLRGFMEGLKREGLDTITAVIVTSDHGMLLGENGEITHVAEPFEEVQVVPLVAIMPGCGQIPGRAVEGFVETVDIAPTILTYLGLKAPRRMQGRSLLPLITGQESRGRDHAFAMIVRRNWYCYAARSEDWLYYLEKGGGEKLFRETRPRVSFANVAAEHPDILAEHRRAMNAWAQATPEVGANEEDPISDEIREMLRKAGYLKYAE